MSELAVRMTGIEKHFGGVTALQGANFELRKGEIHALVGGNGVGKSTAMKMLVGVNTPDRGIVEIDGVRVHIASPQEARALGMAMIFQEFSLVPSLTVAQNIVLTREPRGPVGLLDDREADRRAREIFGEMGVDIDPRALVRDLPTGLAQLTEIAKALSQQARVLIMDEPSAALTNSETQALFTLMRRLKSQGISIVYVSHRLAEVFEIADRITVLRDGQNVTTVDTADVDMAEVIEYIVGRQISFDHVERSVDRNSEPLLEVVGLSTRSKVKQASLWVYPGEIVGIAGLMGSGRTELTRALFGIDPISTGEIRVKGKPTTITCPRDALRAGMALVPEDRRSQGLCLRHSVKENILVPLLRRLRRAGLVDDAKGDGVVASSVDDLNIHTDSINKPVGLLSGGNQQKVVIAKWLAVEPEILIMDEPMAGIDIGAKSEIVAIIRDLANQGKGVIVISSEVPELLAVSDRIVVMRAGTVDRAMSRAELAWYAASRVSSNGDAVAEEEVLNQIIQGVILTSAEYASSDQEIEPTAAIAGTTAATTGRDPRPSQISGSPLISTPRRSP